MARPRLAGSDERIIQGFISRRIYATQADVLRAALKALVTEQKRKDAALDNLSPETEMDAATIAMQFEAAEDSPASDSTSSHRRVAG